MAENKEANADIKLRPLVMKFGGSSVGSADAIIKTSEIIKSQYQQDKAMVIVISAMNGITNLLIACARNAAAGNKKKYQKDIAAIKKRHFNVIKNLPINTQSKKKLIIKI